ncbi:MAG: 23S rRNA (uracil(1939)-C(5))-methyltransferase RlmD [Chromatiales bacterium]|nr:23S rRNA (uracil(1939)-C(5))-methyltransferase RlmD [Chromatiales bacterium]
MRPARANLPEETGVAIDDTVEGSGVLDPGGKRVFVPGVLTGESVSFRRRRRRRSYDEGELVALHRRSPERAEPRCPVFGRCGGCRLQHVSGDAQLGLKQRTLREALRRIGAVSPERWLDPVAGPQWGYRRRSRLAVRDVPGKGRVLVGFRERDKPYVTDMRDCLTLEPDTAALLGPLAELIGSLSIRARIPQVETARADNALALVFRVLDPPAPGDLDRLRAFARAQDVQVWLQPGGEGSLEALEPQQPEVLVYELPAHGLEFAFGPLDFIQVNGPVNQRMVDLALELLDPQAGDTVLDLFSGIGNFALPLARRAAQVHGFELAAGSVTRARENAGRNGIGNAEFSVMDLADPEAVRELAGREAQRLLLDPPRSGAAALLPVIGALAPERIVYVSCHPGTLARDAQALVGEQGYRLEAAGVLDMFPQTAHVESIALFVRTRGAAP